METSLPSPPTSPLKPLVDYRGFHCKTSLLPFYSFPGTNLATLHPETGCSGDSIYHRVFNILMFQVWAEFYQQSVDFRHPFGADRGVAEL